MRQYGDYGSLDVYIAQSRPFVRWFLGSTFILNIYWKLWQPLTSHFSINLNYVQTLSVLTINLFTIICIKKLGAKLYLLFPILSSLWIMFSLGYDEYYPFIAPIYLVTLIWLFKAHPSSLIKHPLIAAAVIGILPLVYFGFIPLSLIIFLYFALVKPSKISLIMIVAVIIFFLAILRFWPFGLTSFFEESFKQMNLGEINTKYFRYLGQSAGSASINFSLKYALTGEHLKDFFYMLCFGGGLPNLLLLISGVIIYLKKFRIIFHQLIRQPLFLTVCLIFGGYTLVNLYYLLIKGLPII